MDNHQNGQSPILDVGPKIHQDHTRHSFDDRLVMAFSRAVTRRTVIRRAFAAALGGSAAVATSLRFPGVASANHSCTLHVSTWGCYCASTPFCGDALCYYDECVGTAAPRCTYWSTFPYCWCSERCTLGCYGIYSCCDCWKYGQYGQGCGTGNTACICKYRQCI